MRQEERIGGLDAEREAKSRWVEPHDALSWELIFLGRMFSMHRRTSCLCPSCLSLGCRGSKSCWILSHGGQEGEAGTPGTLGGAPSSEEEAAVTQLLPAAVEVLNLVSGCSDHSKLHPGALIGIAACVSSGLQSHESLSFA